MEKDNTNNIESAESQGAVNGSQEPISTFAVTNSTMPQISSTGQELENFVERPPSAPVSIFKETPQKIKPKMPLGVKILAWYLWVTFGGSILFIIWIFTIAALDARAGTGAGWGLLLYIPMALMSALGLVVLYATRFFMRLSSSSHKSKEQATTYGASAKNSAVVSRWLMAAAITFTIMTILYYIRSKAYELGFLTLGTDSSDSLFSENKHSYLLTLLVSSSAALYVIAIAGAVVSFMSKNVSTVRRNLAGFLFLSPFWFLSIVGPAVSSLATPFITKGSTTSELRTVNEIKHLSFSPLLPPDDFPTRHDLKIKSLSTYNNKFTIDFGVVSSSSAMSVVDITQARSKEGEQPGPPYSDYKQVKYSFTTPKGTAVKAVDLRGDGRWNYYFTRDGLSVTVQSNGSILSINEDQKDEDKRAAAQFIDSLHPASSDEAVAYYKKYHAEMDYMKGM